jgi:hypothetical protein
MPNRSQQTTQRCKTRLSPIAEPFRAALPSQPRPLAAWRLTREPCRNLADARSMPPSVGYADTYSNKGHRAGRVTGQLFDACALNPYAKVLLSSHTVPKTEVVME